MRRQAGWSKGGSRRTGIFIAIVLIIAIAALVLVLAVMSGPKGPAPAVAMPDNSTNVTSPTPAAGATNDTPANVHPKLDVVSGNDTNVSLSDPAADPGAARDIAFAFQPNVTGLADFTACWTVPDSPQYYGSGQHTVFLWIGIQQGNLGLIQAVLEWDNADTGQYWTLAGWDVNKRDGSHDVSPRIVVFPGDLVKAELRYSADDSGAGGKMWHIIVTDETLNETAELADSGGAVDTNENVTVFSGVLEGVGLADDSAYMPGDTTFGNITYLDEDGTPIPVYLTGYVDPAFPRVAVEYDRSGAGTPVIVHTDYDGQ